MDFLAGILYRILNDKDRSEENGSLAEQLREDSCKLYTGIWKENISVLEKQLRPEEKRIEDVIGRFAKILCDDIDLRADKETKKVEAAIRKDLKTKKQRYALSLLVKRKESQYVVNGKAVREKVLADNVPFVNWVLTGNSLPVLNNKPLFVLSVLLFAYIEGMIPRQFKVAQFWDVLEVLSAFDENNAPNRDLTLDIKRMRAARATAGRKSLEELGETETSKLIKTRILDQKDIYIAKTKSEIYQAVISDCFSNTNSEKAARQNLRAAIRIYHLEHDDFWGKFIPKERKS